MQKNLKNQKSKSSNNIENLKSLSDLRPLTKKLVSRYERFIGFLAAKFTFYKLQASPSDL